MTETTRKAGVLMPISALMSESGIGDFGEGAYEFIDIIKKTGFKIWQILPLNPLGYGNSPYQPFSSKAFDELYISLTDLKKRGLIQKIKPFAKNANHIDYGAVRAYKEPYFIEAYHNFKQNKAFRAFIRQDWVYEYAVFRTLKKINGEKCWVEWPAEHKKWISDRTFDLSLYEDEIYYQIFLQFILFEEWFKLKQYANRKGIKIMGDIPIYVGLDSLDVWSYQDGFLLDKDGRPTFIAGVPPDYFAKRGQRWGNPIYNWRKIKDDGFAFWLDRLYYVGNLYDIVRIDHFRAFDTFWQIPSDCPDATIGTWEEAPGYELFDTLFNMYPQLAIVVEDLGDLRDEVGILRDHYDLMGMRVLEFCFDFDKRDGEKENQIIYTGTHDSETLIHWLSMQKSGFKTRLKRFFSDYPYDNIVDNFIYYTLKSESLLAIIPISDLLHKNEKYRINTPGTIGSPNWEMRLKNYDELYQVMDKYKKMIKAANR